MYKNLIFKDPVYLLLILLIPLLFYLKQKKKKDSGIHFPSINQIKTLPRTFRVRLLSILPMLKALALFFFILALARPQLGMEKIRESKDSIDIILAVDVSGSMLAEDFKIDGKRYNRLDVVKKVLEDFIPDRINDRLGMVVFAGRPYVVAPLTWDHDWLIQRMEELEIGMIEDGTAIGSAIMASLDRLKDSKAKSKVLILLTDGINNQGEIQPEIAAEAARALGVKIYTIGAGSRGFVPYPMKDSFGNVFYQQVQIDIDDALLTEVAQKTGGKYYRALDTKELYLIYEEINQLEKTKLEMDRYFRYKELYSYFILLGIVLLCLEIILKNTVMRRLP